MSDTVDESKVIAELYGAMQTFRMLGFPSDNLYLAFGIVAIMGPYTGKKCMGVVLRWQEKQFAYHIAPVKDDRAFATRWLRFAEAANAAPADSQQLQDLIHESYCYQHRAELIAALANKDILPPIGLS